MQKLNKTKNTHDISFLLLPVSFKEHSGTLTQAHEVRGNHGNLQSNHNKLFHFPVKVGIDPCGRTQGEAECFSWLQLKKQMTFLRISFRSLIALCYNTMVTSSTAELNGRLLLTVWVTAVKKKKKNPHLNKLQTLNCTGIMNETYAFLCHVQFIHVAFYHKCVSKGLTYLLMHIFKYYNIFQLSKHFTKSNRLLSGLPRQYRMTDIRYQIRYQI